MGYGKWRTGKGGLEGGMEASALFAGCSIDETADFFESANKHRHDVQLKTREAARYNSITDGGGQDGASRNVTAGISWNFRPKRKRRHQFLTGRRGLAAIQAEAYEGTYSHIQSARCNDSGRCIKRTRIGALGRILRFRRIGHAMMRGARATIGAYMAGYSGVALVRKQVTGHLLFSIAFPLKT